MKLALAPFASRQFRLLFTGELISFLGTPVAPVAIAFFAGIGIEIFSINWVTALHEHIPPAVLSRVSSYDALGSFVFIPVGLALAGRWRTASASPRRSGGCSPSVSLPSSARS